MKPKPHPTTPPNDSQTLPSNTTATASSHLPPLPSTPIASSFLNRRNFLGHTVALSAATGFGAVSAQTSRTLTPLPGTSATTKLSGGAPFTSIVLGSVSSRSALAFSATVMPLPGQVPAGYTLASPDATTLSASVLSRWPDGSAAVLVASGSVQTRSYFGRSLRVLATPLPSTPTPVLTPARISTLVQSVAVDFGSLGTAQLANFSNPERVWWASSECICARYRLRLPNHPTLEALIDIHAYAGDGALVEVVIENSGMDSANPVRPTDAAYFGSVHVNNRLIASTQSSEAPEGVHSAFRAWHASTWVGTFTQVRATQLHTDLQKHPLLFKTDQVQDPQSLAPYASMRYTPWSSVGQRPSNMGGTGDFWAIGPLPKWDAQFLQSGSPIAAQAVEANALAILGFNVCYRDSTTGLVPNATQLVGKDRHYNWPGTDNPQDRMCWETAHHPAAGLMAFVCRPSPVFIEIAQRIVVMNATWSGGGVGGQNLGGWSGTGITDSTGVYGFWYQTRGRAWGIRSLVHATFLSPLGSAWREGGKHWLNLNRIYLEEWTRKPAAAALNVFWDSGPDLPSSHGNGPWQLASWQNHFLVAELHKAASAKLLPATEQIALDALADWAAMFPVRWVNEQPEGGWRFITYTQIIAPSVNPNAQLPSNWGTIMRQTVPQLPSNPLGPLCAHDGPTTHYYRFNIEGRSGAFYPSIWWAALVAAVERNVPGSAQAWNTVITQMSNLHPWRTGFFSEPRWGALPRTVGGQPTGATVIPEPGPQTPPPENLAPENAPWYLTQLTPEFVYFGVPLTLPNAYTHWRDYGRHQGRKWAPNAPAPAWGPGL